MSLETLFSLKGKTALIVGSSRGIGLAIAKEIAAAGAHNRLLRGPPGTRKTSPASRLPGLEPPLSEQEALEVAAIQSVVSLAPLSHWPHRPFRQPHHSASGPALVGGGCRLSK